MTTRELETLHFGSIPVSVEPEAAEILSRLPPSALSRVLATIEEWAERAPVTAARAEAVYEPEDRDWVEAVITLRVDAADTPTAMEMWEDLEGALHEARASLPEADRSLVTRNVGVHLDW